MEFSPTAYLHTGCDFVKRRKKSSQIVKYFLESYWLLLCRNSGKWELRKKENLQQLSVHWARHSNVQHIYCQLRCIRINISVKRKRWNRAGINLSEKSLNRKKSLLILICCDKIFLWVKIEFDICCENLWEGSENMLSQRRKIAKSQQKMLWEEICVGLQKSLL